MSYLPYRQSILVVKLKDVSCKSPKHCLVCLRFWLPLSPYAFLVLSCLAVSVSVWKHRTVISLTLERPTFQKKLSIVVTQYDGYCVNIFISSCSVKFKNCNRQSWKRNYILDLLVNKSEIVVNRDPMQPVRFQGFSKDLLRNFSYNNISCIC